MRKALVAFAAAATLTACGGDGDSSATEETTSSPATSSPAPSSTAAAEDPDVTANLVSRANGQPWGATIVEAVRTEPQRLEVQTTIVDPRGDNGSPAALQALEVCRAAVLILTEEGATAPYVRVLEEDGTTFALYTSTPAPLVPTGECAEY